DRHVEMAAFHHRLQRGEDFLVGQIARGPEEDQGVGVGRTHCLLLTERTCLTTSRGWDRVSTPWRGLLPPLPGSPCVAAPGCDTSTRAPRLWGSARSPG